MSIFFCAGTARADPAPISGRAWVGQTLTFTPSVGATGQVWKECPSGQTSGCPDAPGQPNTATTYALTAADRGTSLYVEETESDQTTQDTALVGPVTDPPSNVTPPSITGQAGAGSMLTGQPGTWSTSPDASSLSWGCDDGACKAVTSPDYLRDDAVGHTVVLTETATYDGDPDVQRTARSQAVSIPGPTIDDQTPQAGETLHAVSGSWNPNATITNTWRLCHGADCSRVLQTGPASTYDVTRADVDGSATIALTQTASDAPANPVTSPQTATVVAVPVASGAPTISGVAQSGQVLTASTGTWTNTPTSYRYQWQRCAPACAPILGAVGRSYAETDADAGYRLQVVVTAYVYATAGAPLGSPQTATVAIVPRTVAPVSPVPPPAPVVPIPPVAPIAAPTVTEPPHAVSAPRIVGRVRLGATLRAKPGTWANAPTDYRYLWASCAGSAGRCAPIAHATGPTYRPTDRDLGRVLTVLVGAVNAGGAGGTVAARRTGRVTAGSSVSVALVDAKPRAGESTELRAEVASQSARARPAGTVALLRGSEPIRGCARLVVAPRHRRATVSCHAILPVGRSVLRARFAPAHDADVRAARSAARAVSVAPLATTTVVTGPASATVGEPATYTATVTAGSRSTTAPGGRVAFLDGSEPLPGCAARALHDGRATCAVDFQAAGGHTIVARYRGGGAFAGSTSHPMLSRVATPLLGTVDATMRWTFHFTPAYTEVDSLVVHGATADSTVQIRCAGGGCPFDERRVRVTGPAGTLDLTRVLQGAQLSVGARLSVTIARPRYTAKHYRFTVRAGQEPAVVIG